jgi:hypothetical protein
MIVPGTIIPIRPEVWYSKAESAGPVRQTRTWAAVGDSQASPVRCTRCINSLIAAAFDVIDIDPALQ